MDTLSQQIAWVESRWLRCLWEMCAAQFQHCTLPSHNQQHHWRVWNLAKSLIRELDRLEPVPQHRIEQTIIASFFHDVGMAATLDARHGRIGRQCCEAFFDRRQGAQVEGLHEVFEAIEHHDDKAYRSAAHQNNCSAGSLLSILCACDDLDAFGLLGVFRYAEIYALRGITVPDMAGKVLANLDTRYRKFQQRYEQLNDFSRYHARRYQDIKDFYEAVEQQLAVTPYTPEQTCGPVGVLNFLLRYVIQGELSAAVVTRHVATFSEDAFVRDFLQAFSLSLQRSGP